MPTPEQKRGRPALPLSDMIFSAAFRVYSTVSARRFMTDLRGATAQGFISRTPHYNSIFNVLDKPSLTPILRDLISRSSLPLAAVETAFAVDATGFGLNRFYRHFAEKYGERRRHDWLKLHATVGVKTHVITAVEVTDKDTHDGALLRGMIESTAQHFTVAEVVADKAYSTKRNLAMLETLGAATFIPFRSISVGTGDSPVWNRLFHFFSLHREQFLARYHQRSNVESTFSAMKRKFGETIRSKTGTAQVNETLLKVLCHNLVCVIHEMHETGISAAFPA